MKIAPVEDTPEIVRWTNVRDIMFPMSFAFSLTYYPETRACEGVCHTLDSEGDVASSAEMDEDSVRSLLANGVLVRKNGFPPILNPVET